MKKNILLSKLYGFILLCCMSLVAANTPTIKEQVLPNFNNDLVANTPYTVHAVLKPKKHTTLSSQMDGYIKTLPYTEGDAFKKGELLVGFDCTIQKAELKKANVKLIESKKIYESNTRLNKLEGISGAELEKSKATYASAQAERAIKKAQVNYCTIRAPFSGKIIKLDVKQHEIIQKSQPLLEILDNHNLKLELIVPSKWLVWLKPGYPFTVTIFENHRQFSAQVTKILPQVDAVSQTIRVFGKINGNTYQLISGMNGQAKFKPDKMVKN